MAGSDFLSRAHPESKAQMERFLANGLQDFKEALSDATESVKLFRNMLIKLNDMMKELQICPEYDGDRSELFVPSSEVPGKYFISSLYTQRHLSLKHVCCYYCIPYWSSNAFRP